ncbi:MAG: TRAP transporter substrate-binding protein DctP [Gemmatimonadetes bacterium]|nr:TRAP transporter substrate-binding protein DctP [Gemmatimonadota bacterium]
MSPLRKALISSAVVVGALGWAPRAAAPQTAPLRIRLGTLAPQGSSYHRILQEMGQRWRVSTNGQVLLTVYAGTMGSELELVRRMRLGQLQAATLTVVGLREIDRAVGALQDMPMMFRTLEEVEYVRSRLEPVLARRLADRGFVVLFWGDLGWVRYFTRRPAVRPDDFKRLKIFVTAGDNEQFDLMRSSGFSPVSLEWSDALTALQTGMIDAVPTIPYFALAMQFHSVASNMLEVNWLPIVGATIISRRTWEGLSVESQAALRSAAAAAGRQFQERGRAESDEAVEAMRRRGLNVIPIPPAAEAEWRAMSESFYPQIRGSRVPADMFDEVVRLLAEYRASRPGGR